MTVFSPPHCYLSEFCFSSFGAKTFRNVGNFHMIASFSLSLLLLGLEMLGFTFWICKNLHDIAYMYCNEIMFNFFAGQSCGCRRSVTWPWKDSGCQVCLREEKITTNSGWVDWSTNVSKCPEPKNFWPGLDRRWRPTLIERAYWRYVRLTSPLNKIWYSWNFSCLMVLVLFFRRWNSSENKALVWDQPWNSMRWSQPSYSDEI